MRILAWFWFSWGMAAMLIAEDAAPSFAEPVAKRLASGECVVLERRPDETGSADHRFVTVARLVKGSRRTIWETIHDKEHAADFLDGVLESTVVERKGNEILVEQRTHVGGPKGDYRYRLRHTLKPMWRADFSYDGGELKDVAGTWWIFDGPSPETCLVVYSLHIDAGLFAPQPIVKAGMRKSMPGTMACIAREVARREAGQ
ncbi:MAG TPA: SRPBCC family protein [Bacteroidia bacterium]|nr:SRPBCC family protein [Bacteroidia bacterium]